MIEAISRRHTINTARIARGIRRAGKLTRAPMRAFYTVSADPIDGAECDRVVSRLIGCGLVKETDGKLVWIGSPEVGA